MPIECTPDSLADASECYKKISPGDREAVEIYLLYVISGSTLTIPQLVAASQCYADRIDRHMQEAVKTFLLCQIASALGA